MFFTFTSSRLKQLIGNGVSGPLQLNFPASKIEALPFLIPVDLQGAPPEPAVLNQRFKMVDMIHYIGFRSALLIVLILFALESAGVLPQGESGSGLIVGGIQLIALIIMLISIPFRHSPYWLMEPPTTPYLDKIVTRNRLLRDYRAKVRLQGRSETLMEISLYLQYDQEQQRLQQQGDSRLKRARRKKQQKKRH